MMSTAIHQPKSVKLGSLLPELTQSALAVMEVRGLALDSRKVEAGDLFLACIGSRHNGREFIAQALLKGATAVLVEAVDGSEGFYFEGKVPVIPVSGLTARVGGIAAQFFAHPSSRLELFGVTGTNGKTSCSHMVAQMCRKLFGNCGVIGTLGNTLDGSVSEAENTTPDAVSLQSLLADWVEQGITHAAMEVSSHALDQGRVSGLQFDTAILTNLSRDHLDYHLNMEAYAAAKARLFAMPGLKRAVINLDDEFGRQLLGKLDASLEILTFSLESHEADIFAEQVEFLAEGFKATIRSPWGCINICSGLLGSFSLSNMLACIAALGAAGADIDEIAQYAAQLVPVAGRMQVLTSTANKKVVVDYAHTPDALKHVLESLRSHCQGRLICVFGCGGERDVGKRAEMGSVASALADTVILTSDNPRSEDPAAIIADIAAGCNGDVRTEVDRAQAIAAAVAMARNEDSVLIAGKGHEQYQEIAGRRLPFSDVWQVQQAFAAGGVL